MARFRFSTITLVVRTAAACALFLAVAAAYAGGGPENALLIIDPTSPSAVHVGNYYKNARGIPDRNVIYINPAASSFAQHADEQLEVLLGMLSHLGIEDHIDYIVIPPGSSYFVPAPSLVADACFPINNFSIASVYSMAFIAEQVLAGTQSVTLRNQYHAASDTFQAFDSTTKWFFGAPSSLSFARRYFIGAMLGYDGARGNTVEEIMAMIDRAVAVDGTRPNGTFYFMETSDVARSGPRDGEFDAAVSAIQALGGQAVKLLGVLPEGNHDVLGIMTGAASPAIDTADMTILPGAFGDHLTSFAGTFSTSSQVKMSRWIANGAVGTYGTVEEPCNYPGKFPDPRMHVFYFQGASLGEAIFRSLEFVPFQGLIYGDPLTRAFAFIPTVTVPDAPANEVAGTLTLSPQAVTDKPGATIASFDLYVDGLFTDGIAFGGSFVVDTTGWPDGTHDVRVVAYEDSPVATQGRWVGTVRTNNLGRTAALSVDVAFGDVGTRFAFDLSAFGESVLEIRLISGGRVMASTRSTAATVTLLGGDIGPGPVRLHAEAEFTDGRLALSDEVFVDVNASGAATATLDPPIAFGYRKAVARDIPIVIELPATNPDGSALTYSIGTMPLLATLTGTGPTRILWPNVDAAGTDTLTFSVFDVDGTSEEVSITLSYAPPPSACPPGAFSTTGDMPCAPCPGGTFQPSAGSTSCFPCEAGQQQPDAGSISCEPCPEGTSQPMEGQTDCIACDCDDGDVCTEDGCDAVSSTCKNLPIQGCVVPGDFDQDDDVDMIDYDVFELCFGGANLPPSVTCPGGLGGVDADLDSDGDVDLDDLRVFLENLTGPL